MFQHIKVNGVAASYIPAAQYNVKTTVSNKIISAYYPDWTVYAGHANYSPSDIDFSELNTINYAFGGINPVTGDALMFDPGADLAVGNCNIPYFALIRLNNPTFNMAYSFGGWGSIANNNYQSGDLSLLFGCNSKMIATAAQSMVNAMLKAGYNGVDIDYEWTGPVETYQYLSLNGNKPYGIESNIPGIGNNVLQPYALNQNEADGYADFIADIKADLNNAQQITGEKYFLSIALLSSPEGIQQLNSFVNKVSGQSDLKILLDNVDYVNYMTYDMHGGFDAPLQTVSNSNVTDFQSRMNSNPADPILSPSNDFSVVNSVDAITKLYPQYADKIIVGIPAYSRVELTAANPTLNPALKAYTDLGIFYPLALSPEQALGYSYGSETGDYWYQDSTGGIGTVRGSSTIDYKDIIAAYLGEPLPLPLPQGSSNPFTSGGNFYGMGTTTTGPGSLAATPWYYNSSDNVFMSFDNPASVQNKISYIKANGLAGAMMWDISQDVQPSSKDFDEYSILNAIYSNLKS